MKRRLFALGIALLAVVIAVGPAQARDHWGPVGPYPILGKDQGWLTVSNRDNNTYSLVVTKKAINAYEGYMPGALVVRPGETQTIVVDDRTYDLYGNNSDKVKVKVRKGRSTTVSLEPYGNGLAAIVNDGDKVRNGIIFSSFAVVLPAPAPPTVIVNRPPPPPVIVHRPPPPPPRPGYHGGHRPPPPPPGGHRRHGKDDGWGFVFGIGKR